MTAAATAAPARPERSESVALAAELARRELAPLAPELDARRPEALESAWGRIEEVGFDRALLPPDEGGAGLDPGALIACLEELASGEAGVAMLVLLANAAAGFLPPELAAQLGEGRRWAVAPEPHPLLAAGARLGDDTGQTGTVSGTLSPVLGASGAAGLVVLPRDADAAPIAVAADAGGVTVTGCEHQLGLRAASAARVDLEQAPAHSLAPSQGAHPAGGAPWELLLAGAAAIARGVARRALEMAVGYARDRVQGGVAIAEHDAVRRMLATMTIGLATTPPSGGGGGVGRAEALQAKVAAGEMALAACADAVQVFGGTGYMRETGVEKLMRDAKYLQLWPQPSWTAEDEIADAALDG